MNDSSLTVWRRLSHTVNYRDSLDYIFRLEIMLIDVYAWVLPNVQDVSEVFLRIYRSQQMIQNNLLG